MHHTLVLEHEPAPAGTIVRALVRLTGAAPTSKNRTPINISLVLDRSGSMAGPKLAAAREAAKFLVRRLGMEDVVSVVAFDDGVLTIAEPSTGAEQATLTAQIDRIADGGSTNLSGGWLRGRELVARAKRDGAVNRVLLLTDGQANAGITDPALLCGLASGAKSEGITTSTIGFGEGYDEVLLRRMADAGGGNTWYIERPDQAAGVFEEEIEGLLSLAAQNVAVEIRPTDAVQIVMVHHDYPFTDLPDAVRRYELGDLYAREPKQLLVEFLVPGDPHQAPKTIAELVVHAHVLTEAGGVEKREVRFPIAPTLDAHGRQEPEIRRELLALGAARAREEALRLHMEGDIARATAVLREASWSIASAPPAMAEEMSEQAEDLRVLAAQLEGEGWTESDRKYAAQRAYNAKRGKSKFEEKIARANRPI